MSDTETPRLLFSVEDAADVLSISRTRVFLLLKAGELSSVRVGRLRRIPAEALNEYVAQLSAVQSSGRES